MSRGASARIAEGSAALRRQRARRRTWLATSVACAFAVAALTWTMRETAPATVPIPASVVVAVPNKMILGDGSAVELKDGARIEEHFTDLERRVLLVAGEAHFTVRKNPERPFIVNAAGIHVRAVGTSFSVTLGETKVDVIVTEGIVAVDKLEQTANTHREVAKLNAGNRTTVEIASAAPPAVQLVTSAERKELLAWRIPRIELSATPLGEALRVYNQHSPVQITLADPALESLELTGVLRPDNPNALLHVLRVEFGLEAERRTASEIVLTKSR
jgi:transmembrane sensor